MSDQKSPFHRGEQEIQSRLGIRDKLEQLGRRMIRDHMTEEHQAFFAQLPLTDVMDRDNATWLRHLASDGSDQQAALSDHAGRAAAWLAPGVIEWSFCR